MKETRVLTVPRGTIKSKIMAATNYTVIAKNKETEKVTLTNLLSKWTYKQALAIAQEANKKSDTHGTIS